MQIISLHQDAQPREVIMYSVRTGLRFLDLSWCGLGNMSLGDEKEEDEMESLNFWSRESVKLLVAIIQKMAIRKMEHMLTS